MKNVRISIEVLLKFVLEALTNNIPALVQIMVWRQQHELEAIIWTNDGSFTDAYMRHLVSMNYVTYPGHSISLRQPYNLKNRWIKLIDMCERFKNRSRTEDCFIITVSSYRYMDSNCILRPSLYCLIFNIGIPIYKNTVFIMKLGLITQSEQRQGNTKAHEHFMTYTVYMLLTQREPFFWSQTSDYDIAYIELDQWMNRIEPRAFCCHVNRSFLYILPFIWY